MTRTLPLRSALVVFLLFLAAAPSASARVDGSNGGARLQMVWPADGVITSHFGEWRGGRRHDGIDIGMLRSLRVHAVTGGVVRRTGYEGGYEGYGKIIVLDLPGPYRALYAHLANVAVREGEHVGKGEWIGQAGCTGSCSGTHLHFEVQRNGVPVNPLPFLG